MTRSEKIRASRKRNVARHTQWALRRIRVSQPKNLLEATELGLRCVHVGNGAFRKSYRIVGTTLLIKFPIMEAAMYYGYPTGKGTDYDGKCHTRAEVRKIQALRKFKSLRAHMPRVYYYNSKDGVVVMKYYAHSSEKRSGLMMHEVVSKLVKELTGIVLEDLGGDNFKVERPNDRLIFVDLGY